MPKSSIVSSSKFEKSEIDDAISLTKKYRDEYASGIRERVNEKSFECLLESDSDVLLEIQNVIEQYQKKYTENMELYFICEMALRYLDAMRDNEVKRLTI